MRFLFLMFARTARLLLAVLLLLAVAALGFTPAPALAYQEQILCIDVVVAADTDEQRYAAWPSKGTWEVTDITWAPATAVAVHADDNQTITVAINAGVASTSWTTIGTFTTDTDGAEVAFVIGTVVDVTVTKPSTFSRGYQIRVANANGGTGPVFDGQICVTARKVN